MDEAIAAFGNVVHQEVAADKHDARKDRRDQRRDSLWAVLVGLAVKRPLARVPSRSALIARYQRRVSPASTTDPDVTTKVRT
jgi:hypothetical protein